jgi:hypothetical protein
MSVEGAGATPVPDRVAAWTGRRRVRDLRPDQRRVLADRGAGTLPRRSGRSEQPRAFLTAVAYLRAEPQLTEAFRTGDGVAWGDHHVPGLPLRLTSAELAFELRLDAALVGRKVAALQTQASQTAGLIEQVGANRFGESVAVESFVAAETVAPRDWPTWRHRDRAPHHRADVRS